MELPNLPYKACNADAMKCFSGPWQGVAKGGSKGTAAMVAKAVDHGKWYGQYIMQMTLVSLHAAYCCFQAPAAGLFWAFHMPESSMTILLKSSKSEEGELSDKQPTVALSTFLSSFILASNWSSSCCDFSSSASALSFAAHHQNRI